jgi:hypothetical protein
MELPQNLAINWADEPFESEFDDFDDSEYFKRENKIKEFTSELTELLRPLHGRMIGMNLLQLMKQTPIKFMRDVMEVEASLVQYEMYKRIIDNEITPQELLRVIKIICAYYQEEDRVTSDTLIDSIMSATGVCKYVNKSLLQQIIWDNIMKAHDRKCEISVSFQCLSDNFMDEHKTRPQHTVILKENKHQNYPRETPKPDRQPTIEVPVKVIRKKKPRTTDANGWTKIGR